LCAAFYSLRAGEEYRHAILRALGISRREEAEKFLRQIVEDGRERDRPEARAALELMGRNSTATDG
jgi:hypothetical protein